MTLSRRPRFGSRPAGSLARLCAVLAVAGLASRAAAQTSPDLRLQPWPDGAIGQTRDKLLLQGQSHEEGRGADADAQVFWWDSYGRARLDRTDPDAPSAGYRYLTISFDTDSPRIPDTLDDLSLAAGFRLGHLAGGDVSVVLGAGYSSDNLFADPSALYGIGHLMWARRLGDQDSVVLGVDYNGNNALLPDVPLPSVQYAHREPGLSLAVGFPRSTLHWEPAPKVTVDAGYAVPFSGEIELAYHVTERLSAFTNYTHFFNAFMLDDEPASRRLFYQMGRVELGVRYRDDAAFWGLGIDAGLVVGYAFDQRFSRGRDVRDLDPQTSIADAPYVGLVLRGRF